MNTNGYSTLLNNDITPTMNMFHIVKDQHSRGPPPLPDFYLIRLLTTKGTIYQFIDDLFTRLFNVEYSAVTPIKWLLDVVEEAAIHTGVTDPNAIHTWKSNW